MRSPRYFHFLLLLFLAIASCTKTSENTPTEISTNSGEAYFQKGLEAKEPAKMLSIFKKGLENGSMDNDTISLWLMDGIIYSYNRMKEFDSSRIYTNKMIQKSRSLDNDYFEAMGYYRKATIYRRLNIQEEAFRNFYLSKEKFLSIGDSARAVKRSIEMANAQSRMADYSGSQDNATTALKLLPRDRDSAFIGSAYNIIAISYRNRDFPQDAIREYKNAVRYSQSLEDSLSYLNNIALVMRDQGDFEKALATFEKILKNSDKVDEDSKARYIDNYAYTQWMQDSTEIVVAELNEALNIRLEINDLDGLNSSYEHLSNYYENKDLNIALNYALKWLENTKEYSSPNSELNALKNIIELSSAENAKYYTDRFISLNYSLQQANLKAKNTFAKIKFDEEQKQSEIDTLEAETAQQKIEAKELQNQIIIVSLGGLLLMVSSGFGFYYFRQKHKKEKLQEVYKTEARISKKIHDELANDVYNVMSELEHKVSVPLIDKLENIYSRTRNISRENRRIPTDTGFLSNLISNLSATGPENTRLIISGENTVNWEKISSEKKVILYRVLQEIMINMKKHSKASLVAVIFSEEKNYLNINYSDNGMGASMKNLKTGNGILNMENRILSINGKLNFETEQGKGLKILIQVPL